MICRKELNNMFINNDNMFFIDGMGNELCVRYLPDKDEELEKGVYYIDFVSMSLYKYIGKVTGILTKECPIGCICKYKGRLVINRRKRRIEEDDIKDEFSIRFVFNKSDKSDNKISLESLTEKYMQKYSLGLNRVKDVEIKTSSSGSIYIPKIKEDDDILTRMIKNMVIKKRIILNDYKKENKDYFTDNLRSALNGTTKSTTITKFLDWCSLLNLDWKFEIRDDSGISTLYCPMGESYFISRDHNLWIDYGVPERGIYKVPLDDGDDPLKRLIKVAVIRKRIVPSEYRSKGDNPHLFNNMMSGLKRSSKMMLKYFIYWCEILELDFTITITDGENTEIATRDYITQDNLNKEYNINQSQETQDDDDDQDYGY